MACGWSNYTTKEKVVRKLVKKRNDKKVKAGRQSQKSIQYTSSTNKMTQEAADTPAVMINEWHNEPYKDILEFLETAEVPLFKKNNYQISV